MARPLRIEYAGALYHVTARGNARANIYANDDDRQRFLSLLKIAVDRYDWYCHAYCLMDNHYHLLIETNRASLSDDRWGSGWIYQYQEYRPAALS
nr:transposase [uncultured Undibacterium sp.]